MKLLPDQTDEESLATFGRDACSLLMQRDFFGLAKRFGYALAFDREPAAAIEADFLRALESPFKAVSDEHPKIVVKYFKSNSTALLALVECRVAVAEGVDVLLDLIVSGNNEEKHITVEGITGDT